MQASLELCRRTGNRSTESLTLGGLGRIALDQGVPTDAFRFYEQALIIDREIGSVSAETSTLCNLGVASAASGNLLAAGGFYSQSLSLAQEASDQRSIANILETIAAFLIEHTPRSIAAACRMLGTAEKLRDDSGSPRSSSERDAYDSAMSRIRSHLSEHTVLEAWAEGRAAPITQAIADALQQTEAACADLEPPQ